MDWQFLLDGYQNPAKIFYLDNVVFWKDEICKRRIPVFCPKVRVPLIVSSFYFAIFMIENSFQNGLCYFEVELRVNIASREHLW